MGKGEVGRGERRVYADEWGLVKGGAARVKRGVPGGRSAMLRGAVQVMGGA